MPRSKLGKSLMPKKKSEAQERRLRCVYHFIVACCLEQRGRPPTIRQICAGCHLSSTSVAHNCVVTLVNRGLLLTHGSLARGFQVVGAQWKAPPICPQCLKAHTWGTVHYEWGDIVLECIDT